MESEKIILKAESENIGTRADVFISESTDMTRSAAGKICEDGAVFCGGKQIAKNYKLRKDDVVEIEMPTPKECDAKPENIPLDVVYEDEDVIVDSIGDLVILILSDDAEELHRGFLSLRKN